MSNAPIKSSVLNGNLNTGGSLSSQICDQSSNISIGVWNICLSTICLDCKDPNGLFCEVSCNLVKDKRFNPETKQIETYNPSIATVFLKGRKIVYVEKTWFTVNNQCNDLKLFFTNIETNKQIVIDCRIFVTLLFQRMK
jgi:hypothetical protein